MMKAMKLFCAAAMAAGMAFGDTCAACGLCGETSCEQWFTVKATPRTASMSKDGTYKTAQSVKVKSCTLVQDAEGA